MLEEKLKTLDRQYAELEARLAAPETYDDPTRVARLNCDMWGELFDRNRDLLCQQLDVLMELLGAYRDALKRQDEAALRFLMERGTRIKNQLLKEAQQPDLSVE